MTRATAKRRRLFIESLRQAGQLPGVAPASTRELLEREARRPLFGQAADLAAGSLFGDAHKQKELGI